MWITHVDKWIMEITVDFMLTVFSKNGRPMAAPMKNTPGFSSGGVFVIGQTKIFFKGQTFPSSFPQHSHQTLYFPIIILASTFNRERAFLNKFTPHNSPWKSLHFPSITIPFHFSVFLAIFSFNLVSNEKLWDSARPFAASFVFPFLTPNS